MVTAWLKHSPSHPATWSHWVQSNPDVPRCTWLHPAILFSSAWKAHIPQFWSRLQEKRSGQLMQKKKRPFYFHWTLRLFETAAWPWAISGPCRHSYSQTQGVSFSQCFSKRKKKSSFNISINRYDRARRALSWMSSKQKTLCCTLSGFSPPLTC